jgi:GT2 family glycosyltransferase
VPRAEYFIRFDDWEYCLRIRKAGYGIGVIPGSRITHKLTIMKQNGEGARKDYIVASELWKYYYGLRNEIHGKPPYIAPWPYKIRFFIRQIYWLLLRTWRYLRLDHSWLRIQIEWQACFDGWFGRLGKRIDPATFKRRVTAV